jgi:hypothetical protein
MEEFRFGRRELIIGQFPVRMELRQSLETGQRRLRWRLPGREFMAGNMACVSSDHAQHRSD